MSPGSSASQRRILVFLHSFGPGGVERVALRLAGAWADAGHDIRILMGRNEGPEQPLAPANVEYDFAPRFPLARHFETLWLVWHLVRAVRRHRPDVLFCAGNTYTVVAAFLRLILRSECPPIVCKLSNSLDRRDVPWPARLAYRAWLSQHPRFIDHFIGSSEAMRMQIERIVGAPSDRISIIPNPVLTTSDIEALSRPRLGSGTGQGRRFVAVGRLTRQKNFALLLRAFARVAGRNDRLLIVGDGPQRKRLTRIAAKLGIAASVDLPGHVRSVATVLNTADVFVTSSNYEGMPGAVVEALAAGLPIVATYSSDCLADLLAYGELGQIVPIRDVIAFAEALESAPSRDVVPLSRMRSTAAQFTIEQSARLYCNVLAAAAAGGYSTTHWTEFTALAEAA